MWPCGCFTFVAGEPNFTDGLAVGYVVVPGTKIVPSPSAADELRLDAEWNHLDENRA